jgi:hypothetical protein
MAYVKGANRPPRVYRGSRRRVRKLTLRGNWSAGPWVLLAILVFVLLVVIPWISRNLQTADQSDTGTSWDAPSGR